jgi:pyridoxamine 5'-phosphate oxidase
MNQEINLEDIRRDYLLGGLRRENLLDNPIKQFECWLQQAVDAQIKDPSAMTVATVNAKGQPSQRIVLLKHLDQRGFVFYTNYQSKKAADLAVNPNISLHFPWHMLERQVKICGRVEKVSKTETMQYFLSRPQESQLAAWASKQSRPVSSRQLLMQQFNAMKQKFSKGEIPVPDFWGGYRVIPHSIEFWQGGSNRLHDRFMYQRLEQRQEQEAGEWSVERLAP